MSKLLNRKGLDYEQCCLALAKKFNGYFKNYRKFSVRFLGEDPREETLQKEQSENSQKTETIMEETKEPSMIAIPSIKGTTNDIRMSLLKNGAKELMMKFYHDN